MIFFDTESIGYFGPTLLIQYSTELDSEIYLHHVFKEKVENTISLIERITEDSVCGYNLTHDWFHLTKTYNILKMLPQSTLIDPLDYMDVENEDEAHDSYCLKPKSAVDLLLIGKKTKFQSVMGQKTIVMKKIPKILVNTLIKCLMEKVNIPDIYFSKSTMGYKWDIIEIKKGSSGEKVGDSGAIPDPNFVNLELKFNPSASLKSVMKSLGYDVTEMEDLNKIDRLPSLKEIDTSWWPCNGRWIDVFKTYLNAWTYNEKRLEYAKNDVKYLHILFKHFKDLNLLPDPVSDVDSNLAVCVGGIYWKGFHFNSKLAKERLSIVNEKINGCPINVSAPQQVKNWLHLACSPLEKQVIDSTESNLLDRIIREWGESNPLLVSRCKMVLEGRTAKIERSLLEKILIAKRVYVQQKVIGAKSSRMSGGSESYIKSNGSINIQGIGKGELRKVFTLANYNNESTLINPLILCGGDFDAFEVSIAEAVYKDPNLRAELLSGKKIHGLFGAKMYNKTYEEIMGTKDDSDGLYKKSKNGFFGTLYTAKEDKLSKVLNLSIEEAKEGLLRFYGKYPGILKAQEIIAKELTAMYQPEMFGRIYWNKDVKKYSESFFGFRRLFDLEFSIIEALYNLANDLPEELKNYKMKVIRRERTQTASGATVSALYALAFSINARVIRASTNNEIQSPGAEATKRVQFTIWGVQPIGIHDWYVMPLNIHDEIQCPTKEDQIDRVKKIVDAEVEKLREYIPLIGMKWKTHLKNWYGES